MQGICDRAGLRAVSLPAKSPNPEIGYRTAKLDTGQLLISFEIKLLLLDRRPLKRRALRPAGAFGLRPSAMLCVGG